MKREELTCVPELSVSDPEQSILALLTELQRAVLVHPEAAAALFGALVQEGRSYARTTEGQRLKRVVLRSELLRRAELVWHAATQWIPEQGQDGATPSALVDAIAGAALSSERDPLLEKLFAEAQGDG
jgi:hypothetical protein